MSNIRERILATDSKEDMEYVIADILDYKERNMELRAEVEKYASEKLGYTYKLPNVNGLQRPLTRNEEIEIMLEDRGYRDKREYI
jgi:hypothetical protein